MYIRNLKKVNMTWNTSPYIKKVRINKKKKIIIARNDNSINSYTFRNYLLIQYIIILNTTIRNNIE